MRKQIKKLQAELQVLENCIEEGELDIPVCDGCGAMLGAEADDEAARAAMAQLADVVSA